MISGKLRHDHIIRKEFICGVVREKGAGYWGEVGFN
jgi:hypothetical protein